MDAIFSGLLGKNRKEKEGGDNSGGGDGSNQNSGGSNNQRGSLQASNTGLKIAAHYFKKFDLYEKTRENEIKFKKIQDDIKEVRELKKKKLELEEAKKTRPKKDKKKKHKKKRKSKDEEDIIQQPIQRPVVPKIEVKYVAQDPPKPKPSEDSMERRRRKTLEEQLKEQRRREKEEEDRKRREKEAEDKRRRELEAAEAKRRREEQAAEQRRLMEEEAARRRKALEDEENRRRQKLQEEEAARKRKLKQEEDERLRKLNEQEADRMKKLQEEEDARLQKLKDQEAERLRRLAEEEEKRRKKLEDEENARRKRLEDEEREHRERMDREAEERRRRMEEEDAERRRRWQQEEEDRRRQLAELEAMRLKEQQRSPPSSHHSNEELLRQIREEREKLQAERLKLREDHEQFKRDEEEARKEREHQRYLDELRAKIERERDKLREERRNDRGHLRELHEELEKMHRDNSSDIERMNDLRSRIKELKEANDQRSSRINEINDEYGKGSDYNETRSSQINYHQNGQNSYELHHPQEYRSPLPFPNDASARTSDILPGNPEYHFSHRSAGSMEEEFLEKQKELERAREELRKEMEELKALEVNNRLEEEKAKIDIERAKLHGKKMSLMLDSKFFRNDIADAQREIERKTKELEEKLRNGGGKSAIAEIPEEDESELLGNQRFDRSSMDGDNEGNNDEMDDSQLIYSTRKKESRHLEGGLDGTDTKRTKGGSEYNNSRDGRLAQFESVSASSEPSIHLQKYSSIPSSMITQRDRNLSYESEKVNSQYNSVEDAKKQASGNAWGSTRTFGGPGKNQESFDGRLFKFSDTEVSELPHEESDYLRVTDIVPKQQNGGEVDTEADKLFRQLNFTVNKKYDKVKDKISKDKLIEVLLLVALYIRNLYHRKKQLDKKRQERLEAKKNKGKKKKKRPRLRRQNLKIFDKRDIDYPNIVKKKFQKAKKSGANMADMYIELIALFIYKMMLKRKKKKRAKYLKRNLRRMARQIYLVGSRKLKQLKRNKSDKTTKRMIPRLNIKASSTKRKLGSPISPKKSRAGSPPRRINPPMVFDLDTPVRRPVNTMKGLYGENHPLRDPDEDLIRDNLHDVIRNEPDSLKPGYRDDELTIDDYGSPDRRSKELKSELDNLKNSFHRYDEESQIYEPLGNDEESYVQHQNEQILNHDMSFVDENESLMDIEEYSQFMKKEVPSYYQYPEEFDFWKKPRSIPLINYVKVDKQKRLKKSQSRYSSKPSFTPLGVEKNFFSHPIHRIKGMCLSPTDKIMNLITVNNVLLRISIQNGLIKNFYKVYQLKNRTLDGFVEDDYGRLYVSAEDELFVFKIHETSGSIKFDDYVFNNAKTRAVLKTGIWEIKHSRLFYDGTRKRVLWWKNLQEIFSIDAKDYHHMESHFFKISDKIRVIHGRFTTYMNYSEEQELISVVVYQHIPQCFVLFTLNMRDRWSNLVLNNFGDFENIEPTAFDFRKGLIVIAGKLNAGPEYRIEHYRVNQIHNIKRGASQGIAVDFYKMESEGIISHLARKFIDKDEDNKIHRVIINNQAQVFCLLKETALIYDVVNGLEVRKPQILGEVQTQGNHDFIAVDYGHDVLVTVGDQERAVSVIRGSVF